MRVWRNFSIVFLGASLFFGVAQPALAFEQSDHIIIADKMVILEQYEEAKKLYRKIVDGSKSSVTVAYAHYKLGTMYKRQNDPDKAKEEYKKGLYSLKKSGQSNHQIARHLTQALNVFD
ncbi:hypothetical protein MNBD_ALPHA03-377 [hydrothermal vent metagenome]|uniref:Uncharacterized protein n=1 Tax=hydrothermal vent metagenome TaxID=652676 RepID=A0A3B1AY89_9ZZZZ